MHAFGEMLDDMWNFPYTLSRQWKLVGLPIEDAEIFACNGLAAELYGYARPAEMTGLLLSWTQPEEERRRGRDAFWLREHGYDVAGDYDALIERPDGEIVAVKKEVLEVPMTSKGRKVWATRLYPLRVAYKELPDLAASFGIDDAVIRAGHGFTPVEIKNNPSLLTLPNNMRTLIVDHQDRLSSPDGPLFSWSWHTKHVSIRYKCAKCNWDWDGKLGLLAPKCSQCGHQVGRKRGLEQTAGTQGRKS